MGYAQTNVFLLFAKKLQRNVQYVILHSDCTCVWGQVVDPVEVLFPVNCYKLKQEKSKHTCLGFGLSSASYKVLSQIYKTLRKHIVFNQVSKLR